MLFILKEGFEGLIKSKFTGFVATITIAISLVLIGVFLIITVNLSRVVSYLRSQAELEVFLDDSFDDTRIKALGDQLRAIPGVEDLIFVSKEKALEKYKSRFKGRFEQYLEVLDYNPLPASYRVKLYEEFRTARGAERVFNAILALDEIDEEDVDYRKEFLVKLEKYIQIAITVDFIVGAIVCLSALLLVSNNIRLIIMSKTKIIEAMKLVGATPFFIRMPLYVQGCVQGFLGGIIAALFLYGLLKLGSLEIPGILSVDWKLYLLIANLGILLGLAGSFSAVRRYL